MCIRDRIHEILKVDRVIRDAIQNEKSNDEIERLAEGAGMKTLKDNCRELVISGITSMEE